MVAIVSGEGLGLSTSSLSTLKAQGRIGDAQQGRGNDRSYLNIANGNLIIQSLDEHLAGPGLAIDSLRTYNSQGQLNGEYLDSPLQPTRLEVQGGLSSANSRITRIDDRGHSSVYVWDASRNAWLNTDGDGAYDSISYDKSSGTLTWTDGSSGVREIHQRVGDDWMLMSRADADGNRLDFSYDKYGRLVSVVNRNGEGSWYDYSGTPGNSILTQVRTLTRNGAGKLTSVRVRYGYDSLERITSITVDLSPDDASVADGRSYVTRYDYEGSSNRISAVYQDDGSVTRFGYIKLGSDWRIASFSNALGETTRIDYLGNSTWVTDPLGLVTRYDHDDAGQLLRITAPAVNGQSQVTQFAWNSRGDLVQMTDARGLVTTMQYDANGNQVYVRDGAGNVLTRQYSAQNLLLGETVYLVADPDGPGSAQASQARTTQYVYDSRRHLRFVISAEGRVIEYRYNASGQRISQFSYAAAPFSGSGTQTETQMAAWAARQDPRQMLRTDWIWDFRGQLQQQRTASALDAQGMPAAGSISAVTRFVYDPFGLLLQTISPEGGLQANTWDGLGRLLSSTDALGHTTLTRWDDRGNRVSVQAANGLLSTGVYDRAGRLLAQTDSNPQGQLLAATTYHYDADGRLISVQDPTGVLRHLLYDAAGRQVGEIDGRGALTETVYDADNQVLQTIRYANSVQLPAAGDAIWSSVYALARLRPPPSMQDSKRWRLYDGANRLVAEIDGEGALTRHEYDGAGRLLKTTRFARAVNIENLGAAPTLAQVLPPASAEDRITRNFYDGDGLLRATLDAEGYVTRNQVDALGRVLATTRTAQALPSTPQSPAQSPLPSLAALDAALTPSPDDRNESWLLDANGRVLRHTDALGNTELWRRDALGNALDYTNALGALWNYDYDAAGRQIQEIAPQVQLTAVAQDGNGDLVQDPAASGPARLVTQLSWDALGNLLARTEAAGRSEARTTRYQYDALGRQIGIQLPTTLVDPQDAAGPAQAVARSLQTATVYDALGNVVAGRDAAGQLSYKSWDRMGRLAFEVDALGQDLRNDYDAGGRLMRQTDASTQTVSEYGYDLAGNRILERTIQAGQLLQDNRLLFDAQNRMREVSDSARGLARVRIAYDAMGNRIRIDTDIDSLGVQQHSTGWYAYDAMNRQILINGVAPDQAGSQGRVVHYDLAGRRISETWMGNAILPDEPAPPSDDGLAGDGLTGDGTSDENPPAGNGLRIAAGLTTARYSYDDQNHLIAVLRDGVLVEERRYDAAGRLYFVGAGGTLSTDQIAQLNAGVAQADQSPDSQTWNTYDANGQLRHVQTNNADGSIKSSIDYFYDGSGRVTSYQVHVPGDDGYTNTFIYAYDVRDSDLIAATYGSSTLYQSGASFRQYDANGYLTGITDQAKGANNRSYANDARGIALEIRQGNALQRQLVANGEVLGRYGTGQDPVQSKDSDNNPLFATGADLNFTWQVVNGQHPAMQPGSYTVAAGDSLQSIARQQYGDSRLWYLIADANGLSASTALQSGQKLNLPSVPGTSADRADTFKPYDASQLIGDTTPTLPPPPPDDGGCGVLGLIVVVVVAVVVTIVTSGAAAPEAGSMVGATTGAAAASASITASGYFATGLSALAGEYGVGTAIVAGAVGGAAGSIASQLVGMGLGVQDGFSWSGVALGAISTAVGGSLAKFAPFEGAVGSLANTVARTALGNVVTQGIGVVAGLQSSFNWTSVAASAAGSGVGWEVGDALGMHASAFANAEFTERLVKTSISGFAAAAITAIARGGRIAVQQVAVDAFGNALGNSLVETDWSGIASEAVATNAQPLRVPAAEVDASNVSGNSYWDTHPMLYASNDIQDPLMPRVMTDAADGSSMLVSSLTIPKAVYQPEDFPNQSGPLRDQYDLSNPTNFSDYLNAVNQLKANGVTLDPQDISTSKALLFHYYGYRMGELRGTADQLAGSLDDQISPAYTRALQAFNRADADERQDRYDFYSNIRPAMDASGNLTRGRYVDVTQDGRTIRVNWDRSFANTAGMVGVSADEALRKTDFEVYQAAIDAGFNTEGVRSFNINGAWRPNPADFQAITGQTSSLKNDRSAHITSRALDINMINDVAINNGGYVNHLPSLAEPDIVQRFTDNLRQEYGMRQLFQPWRLWKDVTKEVVENSDQIRGKDGRILAPDTANAKLHKNHLHFGF